MFQQWYYLILESVWLWGLYHGGLGVHFKPSKLCFDTCKSLFEFLVAEFHSVVDEILIVQGLLEVPIYLPEVGVQDLSDVIQLTADATK